ncbi:hypothetical protein BO71DRAFT_397059 [Aspergillus ellipticus CBS 707.79]|uniref:MACPF-like domain-containing protein n=1 Tax=Aspergillus ellipticus CBS 707.79 TaxID=1448320 RepID=A0A319DGG5_9EURO|nr:hypothetical protein BO71DRAFT_397059 [Aspergillus ellipticus CBS 707.79]
MASLLKGAVKDTTTAAQSTATAVEKTTNTAATDLTKALEALFGSFASEEQQVLHVYSCHQHTKHIDETACIPFKNVNADKILLSDVRELLLSEKAVEPSLLWSAFCNQRAATVSDSITFKAYLNILNENSSEVGEITEDNADTYRVYFLSEKIQDNGYAHNMLDRGVKVALDRRSTKTPATTQSKIPDAPTSFSHNIFLNPTTTFSIVHAADMSEKHWSVVLRNNSLLNAHQVIDVGQNIGKVVERSMHTVFRLKPRLFLNYQISASAAADSIAKQKQTLRIPRFRIEDDSYIEQFQTSKSVSRAIAQSSLSEASAEAAVSGGAFGFSASASASYSEDKSSSSASSSSKDTQVMTITYNFPRVVVEFDHHSLELTEECKADLLSVDSVAGVDSFKNKYGRFFATRIELGGRLHASEETIATTDTEKTEQARSQRAAAALSFSSPYVQASAKMSHGESSSSSSDKSSSSSSHSMCWEAKGGDTLLCNDPPAWAYTVGSFYNWRTVKQSRVRSLEDVIASIPGYQDTKQKWADILKAQSDSQPKPAKAEIGFQILIQDGADAVTVDSGSGEDFVNEVYKEAADIPASEARLQYLNELTRYTVGSNPLVVGKKADSASQKFYVEEAVEGTNEKKLRYNQPYRIYTKTSDDGEEKDYKWLGCNPTLDGYASTSLIWAGSKDKSSTFRFVSPLMGGNFGYLRTRSLLAIEMIDKEGYGNGMARPLDGPESAKGKIGSRHDYWMRYDQRVFSLSYIKSA